MDKMVEARTEKGRPKGLYKQASDGKIIHMRGVQDSYAAKILHYLAETNYLKVPKPNSQQKYLRYPVCYYIS
jgi:hypothetical protein